MDMTYASLKKLEDMKQSAGVRQTHGLTEAVLRDFLAADPKLKVAIDEAHAAQAELAREFPDLLALSEAELIAKLQDGFVNFYPQDQTNPYVPVAARGPWIVTAHGAVVHDSGGYGMIGFGHAPQSVIQAMAKNQVMANIMTPSFAQIRLERALKKEIGHTRADGAKTPFRSFICMNSGSESVTVATRIADLNAYTLTQPGARHAGKRIMFLTLKGGFHGRTERPAMASNSSAKSYKHLASFRNLDVNHTVDPNDVAGLEAAFAWAETNKVFFECMLMEPVMGEGDPGKAITPAFYQAARTLTKKHGGLLLVDSIQAGLRAQGVLSITDYPGFQDLDPPDFETYSKAVNAGQYPLSILALTESTAKLYVRGVYGNTKTTNPRALDVACAVLTLLTPALRKNIVERGAELTAKLGGLKTEFPDLVTKVQGTGLICSIEVDSKVFAVVGSGQLEEWLRKHGIGVIHGGVNSLRFTPHFEISSKEVDLVVGMLRRAFKEGPRK